MTSVTRTGRHGGTKANGRNSMTSEYLAHLVQDAAKPAFLTEIDGRSGSRELVRAWRLAAALGGGLCVQFPWATSLSSNMRFRSTPQQYPERSPPSLTTPRHRMATA